MQDGMHANIYEPDESVVPPKLVVRSIIERAMNYQPGLEDGLTMELCDIKTLIPPMAPLLGIYLKQKGISLAYSENPLLFYVDYERLARHLMIYSSKYEILNQSSSWYDLVNMFWFAGDVMAKLDFTSEDVGFIFYQKSK